MDKFTSTFFVRTDLKGSKIFTVDEDMSWSELKKALFGNVQAGLILSIKSSEYDWIFL